MLVRIPLTENGDAQDREKWDKIFKGISNNQPLVVLEWQNVTRNEVKYGLQRGYGGDADRRRRDGWGVINIGPLTQDAISRFMVKLSKALYYKHNKHIFNGVLYVHHIDRLSPTTTKEYFDEILKMAPDTPTIERNKANLFDQFIYRFNHSPENHVMYAVVQFGVQIIFQLIAVSKEMDARLISTIPDDGASHPLTFRHECFINQ